MNLFHALMQTMHNNAVHSTQNSDNVRNNSQGHGQYNRNYNT